MSKHSILFVDDDPNILSGLRRLFRPFRHEKDFHFVESGQAALDFMAENNVDVIISDMRMPGMDGAALLTKVQEQFPHSIRIMLTGQADEESILRTVGVVHQFITKPSSSEILLDILYRACALQELMGNEQLKGLVSSIGKLPSLPSVFAKLQQKLRDPECSIADIAKIIEQDLAMSAKVLQLVNSSFFGFFKNIDSTARAVNLLGLDTVKSLVLGVGIFSELKPISSKKFSVQNLWDHSMSVAAYTKKIIQSETDSKEMIDQGFLAGFLHDIGKLVLVSSMPDQYQEALMLAEQQNTTLHQSECQVFNANHGDVGGYLLGLWGLSGTAVESAVFHHRLECYPNPSFCPAVAVHAADVIYYMLHPDQHCGVPVANMSYLEKASLDHRFDHWVTLCQELHM